MSDFTESTVLGLIQAITEFLPVSSSAHLLLPSVLFGWQDQGLAFDVMVHFGSLMAVMVYMRTELLGMLRALPALVGVAAAGEEARHRESRSLLLCLIVASIPVVVAGAAFHGLLAGAARQLAVIGTTTLLFALPLWWADTRSGGRTFADLKLSDAIWIGLAQCLALVPGVSRSGIVITAGLFLRLDRLHASKFSFLLAIPVITAATVFKLWDFSQAPGAGHIADQALPMLWGFLVSAVVSFVSLGLFVRVVQAVGLFPFVCYRLLLGSYLLYLVF